MENQTLYIFCLSIFITMYLKSEMIKTRLGTLPSMDPFFFLVAEVADPDFIEDDLNIVFFNYSKMYKHFFFLFLILG